MEKDKHVLIGRTKKPHGLNGELKVAIDEAYIEDFLKAKALFLKSGSNMIPFFLKEVRGGAFMIAHFEETHSRNDAERLAGKEIYLRHSDLIPDDEREMEEPEAGKFAHCKGYTLLNEQLEEIGIIEAIEEYPQQEMAIVQYKGKEKLIPLHERLVVRLDETERVLVVDLPEGLLEL